MVVEDEKLITTIKGLNWLGLVVLSLLGFALFSPGFGLGVVAGGLLIIANFSLLERSLKRLLNPGTPSAGRAGYLFKLYLRLLVLAAAIFVLISREMVDPFGLLLGLSLVVG